VPAVAPSGVAELDEILRGRFPRGRLLPVKGDLHFAEWALSSQAFRRSAMGFKVGLFSLVSTSHINSGAARMAPAAPHRHAPTGSRRVRGL